MGMVRYERLGPGDLYAYFGKKKERRRKNYQKQKDARGVKARIDPRSTSKGFRPAYAISASEGNKLYGRGRSPAIHHSRLGSSTYDTITEEAKVQKEHKRDAWRSTSRQGARMKRSPTSNDGERRSASNVLDVQHTDLVECGDNCNIM